MTAFEPNGLRVLIGGRFVMCWSGVREQVLPQMRRRGYVSRMMVDGFS
jgi:hypothetical protein